jgi:hypothetical protein
VGRVVLHPIIDYLCQGGFVAAAHLIFYLAPQQFNDAERQYEWPVSHQFDYSDPRNPHARSAATAAEAAGAQTDFWRMHEYRPSPFCVS